MLKKMPLPTLRYAVAMAAVAAVTAGGAALAPAAQASPGNEGAFVGAINAERAAAHLPALSVRGDLVGIARSWSAAMDGQNRLSHNPNLTRQVANWQVVGENVGEGPNVPALVTAFFNSPMHRANILNPAFTEIGVGTVEHNGLIWVTEDFRRPAGSAAVAPPTPAPAPVTHPAGPAPSRLAVARPATGPGPGPASGPRVGTRYFRLMAWGSIGGDVATVQRLLNITADGIFGPQTWAAVVAFQRSHDLVPDAIVGPLTSGALGM